MEMMSRKTALALSVILSLALHTAVFALSPRIELLGRPELPEPVLDLFKVNVLSEAESARLEPPDRPADGAVRPDSIRDLLKDEMSALPPAQSMLDQSMEVPDLAERLAADALPAEPAAGNGEAAMQTVDAKIVEISQDVARRGLEISRQLVAPSSTRVLEEGEYPTLRREEGKMPEEVLMISPLPPSPEGPGDTPGAPGEEPGMSEDAASLPPREMPIETQIEPFDEGLPELPAERVIARAPVADAIKRETDTEFLDELVDMDLETFMPPGEREGYFRLRIEPKQGQAIEPLPKDVTFVIDASNSILQRKLDLTIQGVRNSLTSFRPEDRFNIVMFRDTPSFFQPAPVPASDEMKSAAKSFLQGQESRGQTDVYLGISSVINVPPRTGIPHIILVMTDGRPTTGVRDVRTIINELTETNTSGNTIYAVAGGRTVNQYLLDLLAYRNKGESLVTPQLEELGGIIPKFFGQLKDPILVDCNVDFGAINPTEIYPKQIPDFYQGQAVTVYGRFDPATSREFAMRLTGHAALQEKEVIFRADLNKAARGTDEIARNWAFRKVYFLIGEMTKTGETPEKLAELRSLARQYNIKTVYDE